MRPHLPLAAAAECPAPAPGLPFGGLAIEGAFVFQLKAPSVILFFMEKWGQFITLCSCLGDNCHSSDIKVRATTSSFKARSTHIFLQSGNGVFPSFFKPSQRASATWLPLQTFLETQGWNRASPHCSGHRVSVSSDLYQTLVGHIVMTVFFIYTTPFCGGQAWADRGWEPDESLIGIWLHLSCRAENGILERRKTHSPERGGICPRTKDRSQTGSSCLTY